MTTIVSGALFTVILFTPLIAQENLGAANSGDSSSLRLGLLDQFKSHTNFSHLRAAEHSANVLS